MEDIKDYDEQLTRLLRKAEDLLEKLGSIVGPARKDRITEVTNILDQCTTQLKSFKLELSDIPKDERRIYEAKLKEHRDRMEKLQNDLRWAKSDNPGTVGPNDVELMTNAQKLDEASKVQDQSLGSLARSKKLVQNATEIGVETNKQLKAQTEQLNAINSDIDDIQNNLQQADRQIRAFMRRMATDKVITCLLCLIFVGVIVAIAYSIIDPNSNTTKPDDF
eukprot:TRINITY_DN2989_c0_g3_i2.p1 TRINITY_DN2989_c0_g3~~TRINITY_DN2989_c0_g3_i2.p1  ORF type:complete len:221 (-),score=73.31 TRINITY_DN2989_c0_g3_i2:290-952(-)